jgi:RNA polymerase sigma factor for flagellar operon FliA
MSAAAIATIESRPHQAACRKRSLDSVDYHQLLPLVRRIAIRVARHVPRTITVADLVGYGWVGLMEAYQRADPAMPTEEFRAYASYRVRGAMLDHLRKVDPTTRELRRASRRVAHAIHDLTQALGRQPEEEEIADALELTLEDYRATLARIQAGGMARLELLDFDDVEVAAPGETADDRVGRKEMCAAVTEAIEGLPPRLARILALYYQEDCTLREIGDLLGVTESRVSQLHTEAMHRLRAAIGRE